MFEAHGIAQTESLLEHYLTSNMTSLHRGLNRKLLAGYRVPSLQHMWYLTIYACYLCEASSIFHCWVVSHTFSVHVHAMHVFTIRASSSPPRLPLCQILFLSFHPVAELAGGEKLTTHSVIHPAYLICW